jgi:hypothetical protein
LKRPANDKIKLLAEVLGELLGLSKYSLTFFYNGDMVGLNERLGDRDIGSITSASDAVENSPSKSISLSKGNYLLCLKGGSEGPKTWKRFLHVDDPCR